MGPDDSSDELVSKDDISITALEAVDLTLPDDFLDELFSLQLLNAIGNYHTCVSERRALRNQGEGAKADMIDRQASVYRAQAALIQHEHPNTIVLYKELANFKVTEARLERARVTAPDVI